MPQAQTGTSMPSGSRHGPLLEDLYRPMDSVSIFMILLINPYNPLVQLYSVLYVYPQNVCTTASETTIGRGHFRVIFQLRNLELNMELKFDHL